MKDLIQLKQYGHSIKDLEQIRKRVRDNLESRIFEIENLQTLKFEVLKQFLEIGNAIQNTPESIAKAINQAMSILKLRRTMSVTITDFKDEQTKTSVSHTTSTDIFNEYIFGFDKTPKSQYEQLRYQVEVHLHDIHDIIKWYEGHEAVRAFIQSKKKPGNSQERMLIDFYKRCITERDQILDYYLIGVRQRAINKANKHWFPQLMSFQNLLYDYPYKSARVYTEEYFDCRKISYVYHRLIDIQAFDEDEATILYVKDKDSFYNRLFSLKPSKQIFANIFWHIEHLPIDSRRKEIFEELKNLFEREQWLAFFAVALPQVEGLFTEMLNIAFPNRFGKSLTEVVDDIRAFHSGSGTYLDYYQYILPTLRNQFMHTGHGTDYKLYSYDLLTDLEHVISVFYELQHPFVKINRIIKEKRSEDFLGYKEFAEFFKLFQQLTSEQAKNITKSLNNFIHEFLISNCNLEFILNDAINDLEKVKLNLLTYFGKTLNSNELADSFATNSKLHIKGLFDSHNEIAKSIVRRKEDELENLKTIKVFIDGVKKHFKIWSHASKDSFLTIAKTNQIFIHNVLEFKNLH